MATTTNYGWTTPDDTALVKDGAAAIRTLGSSVDTTTKALNPSTTLGDIEYRSSTANTNTRLGIGSTGNVLTVAGGVPTWAAPAGGGGKVLQVVGTTYATATTIASTTMTDSGLSLSITPTLATSKILILVSQTSFSSRSTYAVSSGYRLMRDATSVLAITDDAQSLETYNTETAKITTFNSIAYLDSPATTSAITYKTQGRAGTTANSGQVIFQRGDYPSSMVLLEIGA